jgi:hypothetical protein
MNENEHISKETFLAFQCDMLKPSEIQKLLEHTCSCDFCADQLTSVISEDILKAPKDMKANILKAARRPEVQIAIKARETTKRMQLLLYSLKVCTATICALLLLLITMNITLAPNTPNTTGVITSVDKHSDINKSLTSAIRDGVNKINNRMLDFSNSIINKEVTDYDQKEK